MSLYDIVISRNNLIELIGSDGIELDLLKSSIQALEEELLEKIVNIIAYRRELLQEEKTKKIEELEEYIQYCLYLARIEKIDLDSIVIEAPKPPEKISIKEGRENMIKVPTELQEALQYRISFIIGALQGEDLSLAESELIDLVKEIEKGEITPF